jgi:hypothetical protein
MMRKANTELGTQVVEPCWALSRAPSSLQKHYLKDLPPLVE